MDFWNQKGPNVAFQPMGTWAWTSWYVWSLNFQNILELQRARSRHLPSSKLFWKVVSQELIKPA